MEAKSKKQTTSENSGRGAGRDCFLTEIVLFIGPIPSLQKRGYEGAAESDLATALKKRKRDWGGGEVGREILSNWTILGKNTDARDRGYHRSCIRRHDDGSLSYNSVKICSGGMRLEGCG